MLTVDVKINGRTIATASAVSQSGLAEYSDYRVSATEEPSPECKHDGLAETWQIDTHYREQTAWALVEKIAAGARHLATAGPNEEDEA